MKMAWLIIGICCIAQISATKAVSPSLTLAEKKQLKKRLVKQEKAHPICNSSKNMILKTLNPSLRVNL